MVSPSGVFVVWGMGLQAAMEDADEAVRERSPGRLVTDVSVTELEVLDAGTR